MHRFFRYLYIVAGSIILGAVFVGIILVSSEGDDTSFSISIPNAAPRIDSIVTAISAGGQDITTLIPTENADTTLYVYGTASDLNGCADIDTPANWHIDLYRNSLANGAACTANSYNCLKGVSAQNLVVSDCSNSGNDLDVSYKWTIKLKYFIDGGVGWTARVTVSDNAGAAGEKTDGFEVATLRAINVDGIVNYGSVGLGAESEEKAITVTNTGNDSLDILLKASGPMVCSQGSIDAANIHYSLTSGFSYGAGSPLSPNNNELELSLAKTGESISKKTFYVKLRIPGSGVGGICINTITFTAKADD